MSSFNALRAIATRLTSTPIDELPQQVGYLSIAVTSCIDILRNPSPSNDQSVLLHKLRTRVSALLQDRTVEGRYCGIVIAKALAETGGAAFLSESGSWVRSLISCLNKPDPAEVKSICVIAVSRIYLLTVDQQALVREVTTPTLPAFISATLGIIKPTTAQNESKSVRSLSPLLQVVLHSWHALIKHFASTFRPNAGSIKSICLSLISDVDCPHAVYSAAQDVLARLHFCAPKNAVASEWSRTCAQAIEAAHDTADLVFRAIIEDWSAATQHTSKVSRKQKAASAPATINNNVLGLGVWSGVSQGCSMLARQVDVLRHLLTCKHAQEFNLPLGALLDLTTRLTAITPPTARFSLRTNNEITRDEREELWLSLPLVHVAVLNLFQALAETFKSALAPVCHSIAMQFWDLFDAESDNETVRRAVYDLVNAMLPHRLLTLSKSDSTNFKRLVKHCCNDLTAQTGDKAFLQNNSALQRQDDSNLGSFSLYDSAYLLLPSILTYAPLHKLIGYGSTRMQIDQTAIFLNHDEAVLASVLNPSRPRTDPKTGRIAAPAPSVMPFCARFAQHTLDETLKLAFEAMLRPRMPVIGSNMEADVAGQDEDEDEDEAEDEAEDEDERNEGQANGYDAAMQPYSRDDVDVAVGRIAADPNLQETSSSQQGLHDFASSQKRDFTTLLEQSMDAQLAASASEDTQAATVSVEEGTEDPPVPKRPRVEGDATQLPMPIVITEDQGQHFPSDRAPATAAAETIKPFFTPANSMTEGMPMQAPDLSDVVKGKERAGYDSNESSDSEVPPIDATLVGISDSEDEDDP
ncbi:hypothetical protein LTR70_002011 [Exophiala xenobiotica]|uniref:Pre-rRNA-processing protein RIX1 n=1 Tax=Lithohypha guttulata TaxID=1690604 RepID=A0ABR0KA28_9EURO|nr:hypothetical protein LTR24_005062 [Lithohypha guttulata]KAK5326247.1 hypothetical protein LTR70_002011 [Exophiala xenobiotica]